MDPRHSWFKESNQYGIIKLRHLPENKDRQAKRRYNPRAAEVSDEGLDTRRVDSRSDIDRKRSAIKRYC